MIACETARAKKLVKKYHQRDILVLLLDKQSYHVVQQAYDTPNQYIDHRANYQKTTIKF